MSNDNLRVQINDYLKTNNLKLKDLANTIGISEQTLKKSLNNKRDFYVNEIYKLTKILNIKDIDKVFFNQSV